MAVCPICDYDNRIGVLVCENCNNDLYESLLEQVATKRLTTSDLTETRELDTDRPASSNPIVLYISNDKAPLAIERQGTLIMGRQDPEGEQVQIDVDLELYGARDQGVSRRHAALNAAMNPPLLIDMGSYNGTFVNGQKLVPDQPHILNSGDELRLGRLLMRLYYK